MDLKNHEERLKFSQVKKSPIKNAIKRTTVLIMSTALIAYPLKLPNINAYFSDKITTDIYKDLNVMNLSKLNKLKTGTANLVFDIHRFDNLDAIFNVSFAENLLFVSMELPKGFGFYASDVIKDSVKFAYDGEIVDITPIDIGTNGNNIKLTFIWSEIESYINNDDNSPIFVISGKGAGKGLSGLGEKFIFAGHGEIADLDRQFFEQMDYSYYIEGSQIITIPSEEEGQAIYSYRFFIDGKQVLEDEVEWRLSPKIGGVEFNAGKLLVCSNAQAANIVITAQLTSNKYFTDELEIELVKEEIIEEIIDENPIFNPEPVEEDDVVYPPTSPEAPDADKKDDNTKSDTEDEETTNDDGSSGDKINPPDENVGEKEPTPGGSGEDQDEPISDNSDVEEEPTPEESNGDEDEENPVDEGNGGDNEGHDKETPLPGETGEGDGDNDTEVPPSGNSENDKTIGEGADDTQPKEEISEDNTAPVESGDGSNAVEEIVEDPVTDDNT